MDRVSKNLLGKSGVIICRVPGIIGANIAT